MLFKRSVLPCAVIGTMLVAYTWADIGTPNCLPFGANVYLPFDEQINNVVVGYPLNSTRTNSDTANLLDAGVGAMFLNDAFVVTNNAEGGCFVNPTTCVDGFTLSFLLKTLPGQDPATNQLDFISAGGATTNAERFEFSIGIDNLTATIHVANETHHAVDNTFTYSNTQASSLMHVVVVWNMTSLVLYRDGVLEGLSTGAESTTVLSQQDGSFLIGQSGETGEFTNGLIDELLFFESAKDASFVEGLFSNYEDASLTCLTTCIGVSADGSYPSCKGANMFVVCDEENIVAHVCPVGYFWNQLRSSCELGIERATVNTDSVTSVQMFPCFNDECPLDPCQNGATCFFLEEGFNCTCVPGYEGGYCEVDIDECESSPCLHGTCNDLVNQFHCYCEHGYNGVTCGEYDGCYDEPCLNGALACHDIIQGPAEQEFNCTCAPGYTNTTCNVEIDECDSNPCQNGATCADYLNAFNCTCVEPYIGVLCELYDECLFNPCENGGNCTESSFALDDLLDYTCHCPPGFSGQNCSDENECITEDITCQNGATCTDLVGNWSCLCVDGYEGRYCEVDIDECASDPCQHGATCIDHVNAFTCTCVEEYDGTLCENRNYCYEEPCANGGLCTDFEDNSATLYNCTCVAGYSGRNCTQDDECITQAVDCMHEGVCVDEDWTTADAYSCVNCTLGYMGTLCEINIDECVGDPCGDYGNCTDLVNAYNCTCQANYIGDNCEEFDNCHPGNLCGTHGACQDLTTNNYRCECDEGWYGDACELEDECITNSIICQHGGTCQDNASSAWQCMCTEEYFGTNCEHENLCVTLEPCENGGNCSHMVDSYECVCASGFQGVNCSTELYCITNDVICENGGTCVHEEATWVCDCSESHTGTLCDSLSPCVIHPCRSPGTQACNVLSLTERTCSCHGGFTGETCAGGPCTTLPCDATGTRECVDHADNTYTCECLAVYEGETCDTVQTLKSLSGRFILHQLTFTSAYADQSSDEYDELAGLVEQGLVAACECFVSDIEFSAGSIVVDFVLRVAESTERAQVEAAIQQAARESRLVEGYDVDAGDVSVTTSTSTSSQASEDSSSTPYTKGAVIAVGVLMAIAVIVIIVLVIFWCKLTSQSHGDDQGMKENLVENGSKDENDENAVQDTAADGPQVNVNSSEAGEEQEEKKGGYTGTLPKQPVLSPHAGIFKSSRTAKINPGDKPQFPKPPKCVALPPLRVTGSLLPPPGASGDYSPPVARTANERFV